jgi:arylsulfatase A-like enzyme
MATKFLAVLCLLAVLEVAASATGTNIIFILADDLGYGDLDSYPNPRDGAGLPRIQTPNLNVFSKEGIRFTDAYAGQ